MFASGSYQGAEGGRMRNLVVVMFVTLSLGLSMATAVRAQDVNQRAQWKQLKAQQKSERKFLKAQQKNQMQSWNGQRVPKSTRIQAKHQMQRAKREMHERQKDARQDLKDRQRTLRDSRRLNSQ
jgi:uncharacterized protein HemX